MSYFTPLHCTSLTTATSGIFWTNICITGTNPVEHWDKTSCHLKLISKKRIARLAWWIYPSLEYKCYCPVINHSGTEHGLNFEFKPEPSPLFPFTNGIEPRPGHVIRLPVGLSLPGQKSAVSWWCIILWKVESRHSIFRALKRPETFGQKCGSASQECFSMMMWGEAWSSNGLCAGLG